MYSFFRINRNRLEEPKFDTGGAGVSGKFTQANSIILLCPVNQKNAPLPSHDQGQGVLNCTEHIFFLVDFLLSISFLRHNIGTKSCVKLQSNFPHDIHIKICET